MKKNFLIFSIALVACSVSALGYFNWTDEDIIEPSMIIEEEQIISPKEAVEEESLVDFFWDVDTRFFQTITKEELLALESISPLLKEHVSESIVSYKSVDVSLFDDLQKKELSASGKSEKLNESQKELIRSFDYSTNFVVRAFYDIRYESGDLRENSSTPHITIVPEKRTEYMDGKEALLSYLQENTKHQMALVQENKLQGGKIYFTVNPFGYVSDVHLTSSCGYPNIDMSIMELVKKMPGTWAPAENANGNNVSETLVVSFGMVGC